METTTKRRMDRRAWKAIGAGGLVLGVGVTATLAAWTDTEWVFGGNGAGGPGVGTSTFEVQQSTEAPYDTFVDAETNPGGELVFSAGALDLTPGDSTYAAVALRTATVSDAGELTLEAAVAASGVTVVDDDDLLFDALDVRVATDDAAFTCDVTAFAGGAGAPTVIADGDLGTAGGSASQALAADAGSTQFYCFEVTVPDDFVAPGATADDYMGRTVAPAWQFTATTGA